MPALQIKDCPNYVYERLREKAASDNRSITQQALTILEESLGLREATTAPNIAQRDFRSVGSSIDSSKALKRKLTLERIAALPPIPAKEGVSESWRLARQSRDEDAR